ncbi:MAG: LLM class flavin-dependent oxidoreductase, partial [Ilumatobacteraceae bacterium]
FGTFTDRFEKLEEALQIIIPMLRGDKATLAGKHYSVVDAFNSPAPVRRIPVMIGGGGERKTLRMVAQYADESNIIGEARDMPRKLDALAEHCAALGRDRSELTVSWQRSTCVAPTMEAAQADLAAYFARRGIDLAKLPEEQQASISGRFVVGDPDTVGERLTADLAIGFDGFTLNAPANGHIPGRVRLLGETAAKVVG